MPKTPARRTLLKGLLVAVLLLSGGSVQAQKLLYLEPLADIIESGQSFEVALKMTFDSPSTGGGVVLAYDPNLLSLDDVTFTPDLSGDEDFQCPGSGPLVSCPNTPGLVAFGSVSGLSGAQTVAILVFTSLSTGTAGIDMTPAYAFGAPGGAELPVLLQGTSVTMTPSVPFLSLGGSSALVLGMLLTAIWAVRKQKRTASLIGSGIACLLVCVTPVETAFAADSDLDGVLDAVDNCTLIANPSQQDSDADGYGNHCDADLDNDDDVDLADLDLFKARFFGSNPSADFNGSGTVDFIDLGYLSAQLGGAPGPTCGTCPPGPSGQYSSTPDLAIPDGDSMGASDVQDIDEAITISTLTVAVSITHSWVGDLTVILTHEETGTSVVLMDRPGEPDSAFGCSGEDIDATFSDQATRPVEEACGTGTPSIEGAFTAEDSLTVFAGESSAGTWTLTVRDANSIDSGTLDEWSLGVNSPPEEPAVTMTAFRPQSEAYGDPLLRRAVAEGDKLDPGVGIRINGDDDDDDGIADNEDESVIGENDLIEVELSVNVTEPSGVEYVLRRNNPSLRVWSTANKEQVLLHNNDEMTISFSSPNRSVWVESPDGGEGELYFEVRSLTNGAIETSDTLAFFSFSSLVIGLHGEFQFPTDPPFGPNEGISVLAVRLHQSAFDSHMYMENEVESDGSGSVYDEIVSAIQNRGVTEVALYGFSHGGGSVYDLSERLEANREAIGDFTIPFTGYIDSVENDSDTDLDPEVRLPVGTEYHVNYYQANLLWLIWGDSVVGADVDELVSGLFVTHITITNQSIVQDGIYDRLVERVPR